MVHRTAPSTALALVLLTGCSIVYDPANHMGGAMDAGSTTDAATTDAATTDAATTDATTDAGPPSVALADFCPMFATGFCANAQACCTTAGTFDVAACETKVRNACGPVYALTATEETLEYDGAAAYDALQHALALTSACELDAALDFYADRDGLLAGIVGTLTGGSECTPMPASDSTRVLVAALSCAGGQSCRDEGMGMWFCLDPAADGGRCHSTFDCQSGRCERRTFTQICGPGEPPGTPCVADQECASLSCENVGILRNECATVTALSFYCGFGQAGDG